ncbi:MAG: collagen-binding domain-containing protein [Pseudobdellovibrionaceae bacterium]
MLNPIKQITLLLTLTPVLAIADCKQPKLHDFTVYSIGNIEVQKSDHQGMTGAGGSIYAKNFLFKSNPSVCIAVAAKKDLWVLSSFINGDTETRGAVNFENVGTSGNVRAESANVYSSGVDGNMMTLGKSEISFSGIDRKNDLKQSDFTVDYNSISNELKQESNMLAQAEPNNHIIENKTDLIIELRPGKNTFNLRKSSLQNAKRIFFRGGDETSSAIFNINGDELYLENQQFILASPIKIHNITWNIFQAQFLRITHTYSAVIGMPGIVMAPLAQVEFNEALITGALYAGEIVTSKYVTELKSGQVNIEKTNIK